MKLPTQVLSAVLVAPVHLQPVFRLPAGLQLVLGLLQGPGQGVLHSGDQLYLLQQLLLSLVLHQVVVNPPLSVAQTVPGNVERPLSGLDTVLQPPLLHSQQFNLRCLREESCQTALLEDKINDISRPSGPSSSPCL